MTRPPAAADTRSEGASRAARPGDAVLGLADPRIEVEVAATLAREVFGVEGRCERLSGERDQNFRLSAWDGRAFVLKISHSAEDEEVSDLQTQALLYIAAKDPSLPTPRLFPARNGDVQPLWRSEPDAPACIVRLLSLLPGAPLQDVAATPDVLRGVGAALARLHLALEAFRHPADRHELLWDLQHAERSRDLLDAVEAPERRSLASEGFDIFAHRAAPALPHLRAQVIHNDLNVNNVLIGAEGRVTGLLDFGDAVRAPVINDVAVAAAYHVGEALDPLDGAAALLAGYVEVAPLSGEEVSLIPALVVGRLAMTVAITAWRAQLYPSNRDYILRNAPGAVAGLERLLGRASDDEAGGRLRAAAGLRP